MDRQYAADPADDQGPGHRRRPAQPLAFERDGDDADAFDEPARPTVYLEDAARSIIARDNSPDVGFNPQHQPVSRVRSRMALLSIPPPFKISSGGATGRKMRSSLP